MTESFLNLTRKDYAQQGVSNVGNKQQQNTNGVNGNNNANSLKNTDVFTAAKNGMTAQNKTPQALAGGNSGFGGINAFGEEGGYGDTVSFSTKKNDNEDKQTSNTSFAGKYSGGFNTANNDSELKELADELGCEANENTVKNKLKSMNPEELAKLNGDALDTAQDLGLISKSDIDKKLGTDGKDKPAVKEQKDGTNANMQNPFEKGEKDNKISANDDKDDKKLKFGTFSSGSEV